MADSHNYSFFGQKTGLILQSSSKHDPYIFFRVIKKKDNETWEKFSSGEGKNVKFSLEEMILILQVLNKEVTMWSSYHMYRENNTKISFQWKKEEEKQPLWINIGEYYKMLNYSQTEVLRLLLILNILIHTKKNQFELSHNFFLKKRDEEDLNRLLEEERLKRLL